MTREETQQHAERAMREKRLRNQHSTNPDRTSSEYPRTDLETGPLLGRGDIPVFEEMEILKRSPEYVRQEKNKGSIIQCNRDKTWGTNRR